MAYAQLAGLPPQYGLYTAFVPVIVGGLFGWCAQLHTGPVAMTSLLTAKLLKPHSRFVGQARLSARMFAELSSP